ncbi:MAG: YqgE/AlgH family protein [Roseibacillus sp.]|nr:YqgE/AlgH family protein [Roseibacillus sp.]
MAELPRQESPIQLKGQLLLADPTLRESTFHHSVILLTEHSSGEGAHGLVLNQPSGHKVGEFLKDEEFASLARINVHVGGPVSREHLTFAALWWTEEKGLRFATRISAHDAVKHVQNPGTLVRAFVGYSGWSEGQLEGELRHSSWIAAKPTPSLLAHSHDHTLWAETLRNLSIYHRMIAECPEDPGRN